MHGLKGGTLPAEEKVSAEELAEYIMKRLTPFYYRNLPSKQHPM